MNTDLISTLFTLNIMQLLKIILLALLFIVAALFVYCRRDEILSFVTGNPTVPENEDSVREKRVCDRRNLIRKRDDRRSGERRSSGIYTG